VANNTVTSRITAEIKNSNESPVVVFLFQGLPKSDKMDLIIQKCTELGVSKIFPVITNRSVIKINSSADEEKKLERWRRISLEASKQSCRGLVPSVEDILSFKNAVVKAASISDLAILAYENEEKTKLKELLKNSHAQIISIFIGPEGGFEKDEVNAAIDLGILPVKLGPRILRTETAGFALLASVMYELGDIG
jgi:16S rRNA (uracil1498-N3)-methyltransferase